MVVKLTLQGPQRRAISTSMECLRDQYAEVAEYWRHIAQEVDNLARLHGELRVKSAPDFGFLPARGSAALKAYEEQAARCRSLAARAMYPEDAKLLEDLAQEWELLGRLYKTKGSHS